MIFCPLGRNFLRRSFLAFVIVSCLAKGYSPSLSLPSSWYSLSPSPRIARTTNAFALRRCELNSPLIDVTNPSPAPSPGLFNHDTGNWSGFPWWLPSLSLKLRSFPGTVPSSVSLRFWALNYFPCSRPSHMRTPHADGLLSLVYIEIEMVWTRELEQGWGCAWLEGRSCRWSMRWRKERKANAMDQWGGMSARQGRPRRIFALSSNYLFLMTWIKDYLAFQWFVYMFLAN